MARSFQRNDLYPYAEDPLLDSELTRVRCGILEGKQDWLAWREYEHYKVVAPTFRAKARHVIKMTRTKANRAAMS